MKCKALFTVTLCALLALTLLGCGATNKLQTITLSAALINGQKPSGQSGIYNLQGNGGTIQLLATGNYSNKQGVDITNHVVYSVTVDPVHNLDAFGNTLIPPCKAPCATGGQGTVEYSDTGLITAVEPATCTWVDVGPDDKTQAWYYVGDYVVRVSMDGVTSQPIYIPIASSAGNPDDIFDGISGNNPTMQCGPSAN